jgi:hypothetical protein
VTRYAIALVVLSVLVPSAGAQNGSMSMGTPPRADAPLQIVSTLFTDTTLTVLLANVSGRTVEQATMGLVLGDGASVVKPVTRIGRACIATVPPDGLLVVTAAHNGFDKADSYFREKGIVEKEATIGLVRVRFADGSEWTYALEANGRFDERRDQTVADKARALKEKHLPDKDMSRAFPGAGQEGKFATCRK